MNYGYNYGFYLIFLKCTLTSAKNVKLPLNFCGILIAFTENLKTCSAEMPAGSWNDNGIPA